MEQKSSGRNYKEEHYRDWAQARCQWHQRMAREQEGQVLQDLGKPAIGFGTGFGS